MKLVFNSPFKQTLFVVITFAISIFFLAVTFIEASYFAHQRSVVIYLLIVQILVILTYFAFRNHHAYRRRSVKKLKNPRLQENTFELGDLLLRDYDYIRETASQAMNDRHTMVNYFLIIVGAVVAFVGSSIKADMLANEGTRCMLQVGLMMLNFIGWLYFMKIVRLRQAWSGSALAMNQIKEFYIQNGRVPDDIARSAFLWDTKSAPEAGRKSTVFYYSAVLVSFIASIALIFSSALGMTQSAITSIPAFSLALGGFHFLFQVLCFSLFLDYRIQRR